MGGSRSRSAAHRRSTRSSPVPDLRGKVALVTGVGRVGQIGYAVATGVARAGAQLVIADRNATAVAERARELASQGFAVQAVGGDLTTPEAARHAVATARERFGGLDVVVNVAGGLVNYGPAVELGPEQVERELAVNIKTTFFVSQQRDGRLRHEERRLDVERELAVNIKTTFFVSQAAIPLLRERGGGAIVNFASMAVLKPQSQMAVYIAAKAAVAGLTRALARELSADRIRVNAVAPGTMRTADNVAQMKDTKVRWVELDDLVAAVLYLASDEARAVS